MVDRLTPLLPCAGHTAKIPLKCGAANPEGILFPGLLLSFTASFAELLFSRWCRRDSLQNHRDKYLIWMSTLKITHFSPQIICVLQRVERPWFGSSPF